MKECCMCEKKLDSSAKYCKYCGSNRLKEEPTTSYNVFKGIMLIFILGLSTCGWMIVGALFFEEYIKGPVDKEEFALAESEPSPSLEHTYEMWKQKKEERNARELSMKKIKKYVGDYRRIESLGYNHTKTEYYTINSDGTGSSRFVERRNYNSPKTSRTYIYKHVIVQEIGGKEYIVFVKDDSTKLNKCPMFAITGNGDLKDDEGNVLDKKNSFNSTTW